MRSPDAENCQNAKITNQRYSIDPPKIAAAIVTYNKKKEVLRLLAFLAKTGIPTFVTANNCSDGTEEAVKNDFPEVSLLESQANLGGTGGFNCAVLAALATGCEYVVLLDDDVLPIENCIGMLADFLDAHPAYVYAAPAIYISSRPDTLQEAGGGIDFTRKVAVEAWYRFHVNPVLPEKIDIGYASACCLMVRAAAIEQIGVMDWNYFIFSDDVDWTLRLARTFGKGACVSRAKALHDFPWAKPFSPMRLYFFHRNGIYMTSRMWQHKQELVALKRSIMRLFRALIYSRLNGDHEMADILKAAFMDAFQGQYGKWRRPVAFPTKRHVLSGLDFKRHGIQKVLVDITIEDLDTAILSLVRRLASPNVKIDVLCDAHRVSHYQSKNIFDEVHGRTPGRFGILKVFYPIWRKKYDLVVTDASMEMRRPTSSAGRLAAYYHAGKLYSAASRPIIACFAFLLAPLAALLLSVLCCARFKKRPAGGMPPQEAAPLLRQIGIDPRIGQPWARWVADPLGHGIYGGFKGKRLSPKPPLFGRPVAVRSLSLGPGEENGGYAVWRRIREQYMAQTYPLTEREKPLLFSVLVPVYNPKPKWLEECVNSVKYQTYNEWELILVDDGSDDVGVRNLLTQLKHTDDRIRTKWMETRGGISNVTNRAAEMAQGDYYVFLDHDDLLDPNALNAFAKAIDQEEMLPEILYADEDRFVEDRELKYPGFKPAYSPDMLLATNYIHHPVCMAAALFWRIGGLRSRFDGSQDHDLLLRAVERTDRIVHIPDILYHMRLHPGSLSSNPDAKPEAHDRDMALIGEALQRRGIQGEVGKAPGNFPGYNRICRNMPDGVTLSIIILTEGNGCPNLPPSFGGAPVEVLKTPVSDMLYPHINGLAQEASGDILLLLSSEIQLDPGWETALIPHVKRPEIGLVGGKIVYQGDRLFSSGLILGTAGSTGRWHHLCIASDRGYGGWMVLDHEVSAVPFQFMGIRRRLLKEIGYFDTGFVKNGGEVDLSLRLTRKGYRHLVIPSARGELIKGYPEAMLEKWRLEDLILFWRKWGEVIRQGDPYINPNFSLWDENVYLMDEWEYDLRRKGGFAAYNRATARALVQRFAGRTGAAQ